MSDWAVAEYAEALTQNWISWVYAVRSRIRLPRVSITKGLARTWRRRSVRIGGRRDMVNDWGVKRSSLVRG